MNRANSESETAFQMDVLDSKSSKNVLKILHVDDDQGFLEVTKQILELEGKFKIDAITSVDEAFKKLSEQHYDAIVSDFDMPGKNGLQFLRELREQNIDVPFIMLTGKCREDVVIQALNLGADYYVNKNGTPEVVYGELAHNIISSIEKSRAKAKIDNDAMVLQNVNEAIIVSDEEFIITSWNRAAEEMFGWKADEVIGRSFKDVFTNVQVPPTFEDFTVTVLEKSRFCGKVLYRNRFGILRKGELNGLTLRDRSGKFIGNVAVCRDITERKLAEGQLKFYSILLDSVSDAVVSTDLNFKVTSWNKTAESIFGWTQQEAVGKPIDELLKIELIAFSKEEIEKQIMEKGSIETETVWVTKYGQRKTVHSTITALLDSEGNKVGTIGVNRDATEIKQVYDSLNKSNERFKKLADSLPEIVFEANLDGNLTYVNQKGFTLTGYSQEDFDKSNCVNFLAPEDRARAKQNFMKAITASAPTRNEYTFMRKDGTTFPALVESTAVITENKAVGIRGLVIDLTEQKKNLEQLLFQAKILDAAGQAIIVVDKQLIIRYWNPAAEKLYGWSAKETLDRNAHEFLAIGFSPEQAEVIAEKLMAGENWSSEAEFRRRDGSFISIIVNRAPILDEKGILTGATSIATDISEQKMLEKDLEKNADELSHSIEKIQELNEKLSNAGSLTRHDVRNKLSLIKGNVFLAKKSLANAAQIHGYLDNINEIANSINRILDFAKNYEMIGTQELKWVNVEEKITEASFFVTDLKGVKLISKCQGLEVKADSLLAEVFHNLIDNSLKYGETLTQIKIYFEESENGSANIVYEDDGVGIDPSVKEKVFQKGFGKGTGYGLYLISRICNIYGWTISENGQFGKGAKFTLNLPPQSYTLKNSLNKQT